MRSLHYFFLGAFTLGVASIACNSGPSEEDDPGGPRQRTQNIGSNGKTNGDAGPATTSPTGGSSGADPSDDNPSVGGSQDTNVGGNGDDTTSGAGNGSGGGGTPGGGPKPVAITIKADPRCTFDFSSSRSSGWGNLVQGSPNVVEGNGNLVQGDHLVAIGNGLLVQGSSVCAVGDGVLAQKAGGDMSFASDRQGTSCDVNACSPVACGGGRTLRACVDSMCLTTCPTVGTSPGGTPYQAGPLPDGRFGVSVGTDLAIYK